MAKNDSNLEFIASDSKDSLRIFAPAPQDSSREPMFTSVIKHTQHEDGSYSEDVVLLEKELEPLSVLNFKDHTIGECIRHGISLPSLKITPDSRLGCDEEIEKFNQYIDEHANDIFNV